MCTIQKIFPPIDVYAWCTIYYEYTLSLSTKKWITDCFTSPLLCLLDLLSDRFLLSIVLLIFVFIMYAGGILWMRPASERQHHNITSSPIGWAHTQWTVHMHGCLCMWYSTCSSRIFLSHQSRHGRSQADGCQLRARVRAQPFGIACLMSRNYQRGLNICFAHKCLSRLLPTQAMVVW